MCNYVGGTRSVGGLAAVLAGASGVLDISEMRQSSNHDKSFSISQLIKGKSKDLHNILKYFNETTTFMFNVLLLIGFFPFIIFFTLKRFTRCCLVAIYPIINSSIIFIRTIIHSPLR